MNKGLELIEAHWLFNCPPEKLEVVIHPQSVIHSMVRYRDGSVLAQLGNPDMRTPIAYCLGLPERIDSGVGELDSAALSALTFQKPDFDRFPMSETCLSGHECRRRRALRVERCKRSCRGRFFR